MKLDILISPQASDLYLMTLLVYVFLSFQENMKLFRNRMYYMVLNSNPAPVFKRKMITSNTKQPHFISQDEFNDLMCDLNIPKEKHSCFFKVK